MKLPTISLAMMVKNEEDFLEDALKSAKDWVDEMIVVDTGSTDKTVEIARDMGAQVHYFEWPNDFSKARNETIRHCRGDWIAILDADERFVGAHPERVKEILQKNEHYPYQAYMLKVINMNAGKETHSFFSQRIFPNHPDLGYSGRVHNHFGALSEPSKLIHNVQCVGLDIVHLGYDKEIFKAKKKLERNLALLEAAVKEEPDVSRYKFYLGREYILQNRLEESEKLLLSVYQQKEIEPLLKVEAAQCLLGIWNKKPSHLYQAIEVCIDILDTAPHEIDTWYYLGECYQKLNLEEESIHAYEESIKSMDVPQIQTSRVKQNRGELEFLIAEYYWKIQEIEKALFYYDLAFDHLKKTDLKYFKCVPQHVLLATALNDMVKLEKSLHLLVEHHEIHDILWDEVSHLNLFFQILDELVLKKENRLIKSVLRKSKMLNPMISENESFIKINYQVNE